MTLESDIRMIRDDIKHEMKKADERISLVNGDLNRAIRAIDITQINECYAKKIGLMKYIDGLRYTVNLIESFTPELFAEDN